MTEAAHARLGASSSKQWMTCTKSPDLTGDRERKPSIYTAEGSVAHAYAESLLLGDGAVQVGQTVHHEGFDIEVTKEMRQHVLVYTDECETLAEDADWVAIEQRVYLDELWDGNPPEPLFGTGDFMAVRGTTAFLRDLKYGKGVGVEVHGNTQLMYYGVGMYFLLPDELKAKVEWFDLGIVQPRHDHTDGPVRSLKVHVDDLLNWAMNELKPVVDDIAAGNTHYATGDHCRWCPAAGNCEALHNRALDVARMSFDDDIPSPVAPGSLTNDELGQILNDLPILRDWIAKVQSEATDRAERGGVIPGWKLVPKRAIRKWTDDQQVMDILVGLGVPAKEIAEIKVGTVASIEKALKQNPEAWDSVRHLIDKSSSGNTLAPVDDKRDAVSPPVGSAHDDFDAVDVSQL